MPNSTYYCGINYLIKVLSTKKQEQLRLSGKHPVPSTKAKALSLIQGGAVANMEELLVATKKVKVMDRGRGMLMIL